MKKIIVSFCLVLLSYFTFCQTANKTDFNFGFEKINNKNDLPDSWFKWGMAEYILKVDSVEKNSGDVSMLIETIEKKTDNSFGCIAASIPGEYEGYQVEVRAYMKLQNVVNGAIGLMLRIDGEEGMLKFDNMLQKNIQGSSDWKMYSVILPLPEDAKTIVIGALLSGTGKLWVDDFQVLIDQVDISKAKPKKKQIIGAEIDSSFAKGSNIPTPNLSTSKIDDLTILCKVWGFLKYYHPAVAKGDLNWDYELFRIMPKIINCNNHADRNRILSNWILNLGEITADTAIINIERSVIKLKPDLDWITDNVNLGDELARQLVQIKKAKRVRKNYYIQLTPRKGNPQFKNEKAYSKMTNPDVGFRLLSLFRYWNIIQYYFPYKNLLDENWDGVLMDFIPKFINAEGELNYKLNVLELIAKVHDTHANIWGNDTILNNYRGRNYAPIEIKFIENKAVVTAYLNKENRDKPEIAKGDNIVSINNTRIDKIIEDKLPFTPASNYSTQLRDIARDLLRTNDNVIDVEFIHENIRHQAKLNCFGVEKVDIYHEELLKDTCFKLLSKEIAYLYPGSIRNSYLPNIMPAILNSKGLIIDMRCYPREFIVFSLGEYLLPDSKKFVEITNASMESPGLFSFSRTNEVGKKNSEYYKGKVVIIINEATQSQAEYTTMAFRVAPTTVVIGSTTAGADGDISGFYLPGGIRTAFSGIGIYYPDGKETQRIGIVPDIEIKPTIKGIIENRDELLEKAIAIINEK